MPALSFSVFKDKIISGAKRQTIRTVRKRAIAAGDKLFLFWKQQSPKDCEKLGEATCTSVKPIKISYGAVYCNIPMASLEAFAIADGFKDWNDLVQYFEKNYGLPFEGVLIQWDSINVTD